MRRKSEKDEAKVSAAPPNTTAPVKRGPGRPPGSMNKSTESKLNSKNNSSNNTNTTNTTGAVITNNGDQPPEKKMKTGPVKEPAAPAKVAPIPPAPVTPQKDASAKEAPAPAALLASPKNNPLKWSVQQVCDFIKNLPGCSDYVEDFALQEIDGQALMLLGAEHLMTAMSIKLGPALKICEQVKALKDEIAKN